MWSFFLRNVQLFWLTGFYYHVGAWHRSCWGFKEDLKKAWKEAIIYGQKHFLKMKTNSSDLTLPALNLACVQVGQAWWQSLPICRKKKGLCSSIKIETTWQLRFMTKAPPICSDNLALTCHVFVRLIRNFWRTEHHFRMYLIHLVFLPYFFFFLRQAFWHKSQA